MTETNVAPDSRRVTKSRPRPSPQLSPRAALMAAWQRHQDLLKNASTLAATTGVTSLLGFVYWAAAARIFSQQAVGYGAAAISAMTLLGTIGMLGMGTLLIGELPRRNGRAGLVSAALVTCAVGSLVLALSFVLLAAHFSRRFEHVSGTPIQTALFTVGVVLTGVSLVFDQATIGLMRGGLQLTRNTIFAASKLLVLPITAIILHDRFGVGMVAAWVAGIGLSMVLLAIRLRLSGSRVLPRPDWGVLRRLGGTALAHNWLNLSMTIPLTLIPVLVTVIVSPRANAAFYTAWMLSGFLKIVPLHLSTVLFAIAAADPQVIARKLRFTLRLSLIIGLPSMAVLGFGAHFALSLFGPGYARAATLPLCLLVIGYLPTIPKMLYIAVCRAVGRIPRAAAVMTAAAVMEVTAAAAGGAYAGLKGLSFALLGVYILEGVITSAPVIRAAIGSGRHRRADSLTASAGGPSKTTERSTMSRPQDEDHLAWDHQSQPAYTPGPVTPSRHQSRVDAATPRPYLKKITSPSLADPREQDQQKAGLAALLSLARGEVP